MRRSLNMKDNKTQKSTGAYTRKGDRKTAPQLKDRSKKKMRQIAIQRRRDAKLSKFYEPHGLFEALNHHKNNVGRQIEQAKNLHESFEQLKSTLQYGSQSTDLLETVLCRIEDIMSLMLALSNVENVVGAVAAIQLYARTFYTKSMLKTLTGVINKIFQDDKPSPQAQGDEVEPTMSAEDKIREMKQCVLDWKKFRHGAFAKNFVQLINILATFGIGNLQDTPIAIGTIELFRARAWDVQKQSIDFFEMVVETIAFFVERGYLAFAKGDLSLLMYDDEETAKYEQEYSLLISCDTLLETGRLADLKTESINGEADFEERLEALIMKTITMISVEKNPAAKTVLTNRLVILKKMRSKLVLLQKASPVREKPYGICIFGGSAVGKTLINTILVKVGLQSNGFPSGKEHVVTLNDSDPFQSEYRTFHQAVTMDDFGNTKADKYEFSPTAKIIDFLNNVPKAALSPIAELKGNVMIRPKIVSVTTNVKHLLANVFSNEPASILRRFNVHLDVRLRDDWIDSETGGIKTERLKDVMIPDAWLIDIQVIKIIRTQKGADNFQFVCIKKNASIRDVIDYIRRDSALFFQQQKGFVNQTEQFYDLQLCEHMDDPKTCKCCKKNLDVQCKEVEDRIMAQEDDEEMWEPLNPFNQIEQWYRNMGVDEVVYNASNKVRSLHDAWCQWRDEKLSKEVILGLKIVGGTMCLIGVLKTIQCFRRQTNMIAAHGREDGIPQVVEEDHENNWKQIEFTPLPRTEKAATMSGDQFMNVLKRHMAFCTIYNNKKNTKLSCTIFPIQGNTWLLPGHMVRDHEDITIVVQQGRDDTINRTFQENIGSNKIQFFGHDYALVRLLKGGPVRDMLDMIVQDDYPFIAEAMDLVMKGSNGTSGVVKTRARDRKMVSTTIGELEGISYHLGISTKPGMCMSALVTKRTPHQIVGFHLAGRTGTGYGVAGVINANLIRQALGDLDCKNNLSCHSEGNMTINKYGTNYKLHTNIPQNHSTRKMKADESKQPPCALIYGAHDKGSVDFRTNVRKSPISNKVTEIMQIPRMHGPSTVKDVQIDWQRDLDTMMHPKGMFATRPWERAVSDFQTKIIKFMDANPKYKEITYPLCHEVIMSGADGIAAYSRINLKTSMGWPLNKAKNGFIEEVEKEMAGISAIVDFNDPQFMEEIVRMENELKKGKRVHTIFRACLKDEPVKWTKKKKRVFAGCEVAFTYLVRKYYLPLVRVLQNNWLDFECAVGINCHGPAWEKLTQHLSKYGKDRILAGDYGAYDKTMNPEVMMSAFDMLFTVAESCGYTEEDLMVMRGLATEMSYPIYEYDGVFIQMFGSSPSGHPLTVIINNLVNSLYMRYCYYTIHDGEEIVPPFDSRISLCCYGDDNIMGVHPEEKVFNMASLVGILTKVGMKYTKADKTEIQEGDEFSNLDDVEFLKRKFTYNPAFGAHTAALSVSSIAKSLHNVMKSKTTSPEEASMQAMRSACMEFAMHGPDVFHERRKQLEQVAIETGLHGYMGELPTLKEMVDRYDESRLAKDITEEPVMFELA